MQDQHSALFHQVERLISIKADKYFSKAKLLMEGSVAWPVESNLYLAIYPYSESVYYCTMDADGRVSILGGEVSSDDLVIVTQAIRAFNEDVDLRNNVPLKLRLQKIWRGALHAFTNFFNIGPHIYQGQYLDESAHTLGAALKHYVSRAIEVGNETLKLERSQIIEGRFFFCMGEDQYYVLFPDTSNDNLKIYLAQSLSLDGLTETAGIRQDTERSIVNGLKLWLSEIE